MPFVSWRSKPTESEAKADLDVLHQDRPLQQPAVAVR